MADNSGLSLWDCVIPPPGILTSFFQSFSWILDFKKDLIQLDLIGSLGKARVTVIISDFLIYNFLSKLIFLSGKSKKNFNCRVIHRKKISWVIINFDGFWKKLSYFIINLLNNSLKSNIFPEYGDKLDFYYCFDFVYTS